LLRSLPARESSHKASLHRIRVNSSKAPRIQANFPAPPVNCPIATHGLPQFSINLHVFHQSTEHFIMFARIARQYRRFLLGSVDNQDSHLV